MEQKKRVAILVTIALILAVTAITLNLNDSEEIPTTANAVKAVDGSGEVGIKILPPQVEDKLTGETPQ